MKNFCSKFSITYRNEKQFRVSACFPKLRTLASYFEKRLEIKPLLPCLYNNSSYSCFIHTHAHTYTFTYTQTHTLLTHVLSHIHYTYKNPQTHSHKHINTHIYTQTSTLLLTHRCKHTNTYTCTFSYTHKNAHTNTHT